MTVCDMQPEDVVTTTRKGGLGRVVTLVKEVGHVLHLPFGRSRQVTSEVS